MDMEVIFMTLLPFSFFLLVPLVLIFAFNGQKKLREELGASAAALGLELTTGTQASAYDKLPSWAKAVFSTTNLGLSGVFQGFPLKVWYVTRGGKNQTTWTCFRLGWAKNTLKPFKLYKEGLMAKTGKVLLGTQDITTGFEDFDTKVMVQGTDEGEIRTFLGQPGFRTQIIEFLQSHSGAFIDHEGIYHEVPWVVSKEEKFRNLLEPMVRTVSGGIFS